MNPEGADAVVFAYHDIGVRGIETLLARGVNIRLIVTHEDDPDEERWFASVAECARLYGIECIAPERAGLANLVSVLDELAPDFVFSFYYRHMIPAALLATVKRAALNLHGSLLPRYRGRAPVNWAVLAGESETGASLHHMTAEADAGDLVAQETVPILPNDTAGDVMAKVAVAGERLLWRWVPELIAGRAPRTPLDLDAGNYCGRRRPEDGRIDWGQDAWHVHNLVRAVAPPYPGAFTEWRGGRLFLLGSHFRDEQAHGNSPAIYAENESIYADCTDGKRFEVLKCALENELLSPASLRELTGGEPLLPGAKN